MRHLDLFSGIGGFALAVRWLGHETVGFCEIDPWCRKVLDKHWPEVAKHDDIRTLTGTEFGPIDLVTGGFPCQPFSVAGQRRGEDDPRHLWPAMHRIIDASRPRFVLAENVAGIVNMALDGVLADLEAIGYATGAVVIPAGAVNALHRRDRVWIMAYRDGSDTTDGGQRPAATGEGAERRAHRGRSHGDAWQVTDGSARQDTRHMANTGHAEPPGWILHEEGQQRGTGRATRCEPAPRCHGMGYPDSEQQPQLQGVQPDERRRPSNTSATTGTGRDETARALDAGPDGLSPRLVRRSWADGTWEVGLPRVVAHEPGRKQKLQAAGNAIVPQVAYEILRVMIGEAA